MLLSFFEFIGVGEHLRGCVSALPSNEKSLSDGRSIVKEKDRIKKKNRAKGKGLFVEERIGASGNLILRACPIRFGAVYRPGLAKG